MADTALPLQRKRSGLLDGMAGNHGQGMGSGSGAGMWLSGTATEGAASEGRKYHISAEASQPQSTATSHMLLALNPSGSGDVDLDLSFDFVSQLESNRPSQTPQKGSVVPDTESPRGMSAARWASRSRKQPPAALSLSNKKPSLDITSQFSPISPLDGKADGEAPLIITPLSSTRRAVDAGIQPTSAAQTEFSKGELIRQQRLAAQHKQREQQRKEQLQKEQLRQGKVKRSVPFGFGYKDEQANGRKALGENKGKGNAQMIPSVEQGDVFDDPSYDYKRHLKKSPSLASTQTGGPAGSFATAHESQGTRARKRRQQGSTESANTFDTALTRDSAKTTELPVIELQPPLPSGNMLGLDITGSNATDAGTSTTTGLGLSLGQTTMDSPMGTLFSSPHTPFSPLFSESGTNKGSEYTHGTMSEGSRTPGTAFSTLFDERTGLPLDAKMGDSANMLRGHTAPLSTRPFVGEVIQEEKAETLQVRTAPASSFLVDLPALDEDELRRLNTHTTASEESSSPRKGDQPMIVSTTSSPTDEFAFLFRHPSQGKASLEEKRQTSGARVGPWPQSPLLLGNFMEGDVSDELKGSLGLGIDLGTHPIAAQHLQLDMSELSVERAVLSHEGENLQPHKEAHAEGLPSFVSSTEGFAINVTPAVKQPDHMIDVPDNVVETERDETMDKVAAQGHGRWSSKLWSMASPFRSSSRGRLDEQHPPPMRVLTLVSKRENDQEGAGSSKQHKDAFDGYHSMPSSAVLPSAATFEALQAPPEALYSQPRSSKHIKRSSRLRYRPNELGHVGLEMDKSPLEDLKSPRVAQSPSGFTPKMEYFMSAKNNRHSWGCASTSAHTGTPSWLAPYPSSVAGQRESDLIHARNSTLSAVGPEYRPQVLETVGEDGMRRRATHRATNSVPTTPTLLPEAWTMHPDDEEPHDARAHNVQFQAGEKDQRGRKRKMIRTMSIFGPASAAITPYLVGLSGSRNRGTMVKPTRMHGNAETRLSLFTDHRGGPDGLFAYSGKALENASPSRSLFFAGFLLMPWLWYIGGWGLEDNGKMHVDRDIFWEEGDEEALLLELLQKEPVGPLALRASSRSLHQSTRSIHRGSARTTLIEEGDDLRYSMGKPASIIDMEEELEDMQRRQRPHSFVEKAVHFDGEQSRSAMRKTRSLLEGGEQNGVERLSALELQALVASEQATARDLHEEASRLQSIDLREDYQSGIAYSTEDNVAVYPQIRTGLPLSQWDEYEDTQKPRRKGKNFLQQVIEANSTILARLGSSQTSLSATRDKKKAKVASRSMLVTVLTDWSRLERFVFWNRVMALITSLVVFGGFIVAICVVISDW